MYLQRGLSHWVRLYICSERSVALPLGEVVHIFKGDCFNM